MSNVAIRIAQRKALERAITSEETVGQVLVEAVREVRNQFRATFDINTRLSPEAWDNYFDAESRNFTLLSGFYVSEKPYISLVRVTHCIAELYSPRHAFCTIGTGGELGDFLLKELCEPHMDYGYASAIAVYVIEKVSRHNRTCSPPVRLARLFPRPWNETYPPDYPDPFEIDQDDDEVIRASDWMRTIDEELKAEGNKRLQNRLIEYSNKLQESWKKIREGIPKAQ